jgi:aspergillopepsin I
MVAIHQVVLLLFAIAGSFAIPLAAPSKPASGSKAYSVPAIHNTNFVRNGTAALLKAYAKYGLKPENKDNILNSYLDKRQDSSVTATPDNNDVEYTCPVTIGAQTLNLDIDTGSADLSVQSA